MRQRVTRRVFLAASGAMGARTLLTGAIGFAGPGNEARADQQGERGKKMPGIAVDMPWQRRKDPALSGTTTPLDWYKTYCYSPHVIRTGDGYRM